MVTNLPNLEDIWASKALVFIRLRPPEQMVEKNLDGTVFTESVAPDDLEHISDSEKIKELVTRAHIRGAGKMVRLIKLAKRVIWDNMGG